MEPRNSSSCAKSAARHQQASGIGRTQQPCRSAAPPQLGLLVKLPCVGGCRESADWACPCRGPVLDQRLPTFRRGAPRAATGGRA
jgi:hypothetical protein